MATEVDRGLWNVSLMIESQVVRIGMEGMLNNLDRVRSIQICEQRLLDSTLLARSDILITTFDEWRTFADTSKEVQSVLPRVLVLGNEPYEWSEELFTAFPVDGFLSLHKLSVESIEDAISCALDGKMPMPPDLSRRLLTANRVRVSGSVVRSVSLTPRERETLALLAAGFSNKQIARRLDISIHGAKRLVGSILLKLGAPNRTGAVVVAQKAGLV